MQPPDAIATIRAPGLSSKRLQIDVGIFPDLRIDEALEGEGEEALADAVERRGLEAMYRFAKCIGGSETLRCLTGQYTLPPKSRLRSESSVTQKDEE